ncbi:MAG: HigA family addiction module antitoxin [Rhodospirillales bacterium]|jgi:addiction module HigA family antidote|nr:HigA family addiction module antitoxin [Rhodospirillales bacterium]
MKMFAVHPGQGLRLEMDARNLSANALALALRVPSGRITDILAGKRAITPETALRLGRYFGTGPELWLNLQSAYDLAKTEKEIGAKVQDEVKPAA